MGWDTTDQDGQEYTGQHAGEAHQQGFKLELMEEGDVLLSDREEPGNAVTLGSSKGEHQICPGGLWEGSSRNVMCLKAQLKYLYISACSKGNKQEEMETVVQLENYDLIAITKNMVG